MLISCLFVISCSFITRFSSDLIVSYRLRYTGLNQDPVLPPSPTPQPYLHIRIIWGALKTSLRSRCTQAPGASVHLKVSPSAAVSRLIREPLFRLEELSWKHVLRSSDLEPRRAAVLPLWPLIHANSLVQRVHLSSSRAPGSFVHLLRELADSACVCSLTSAWLTVASGGWMQAKLAEPGTALPHWPN